ncbi:protein BIG GRAIN 1-like E [Asparagus officinalis]|uniref:protein BIG GRAIN 1-like E n=1 Tax=Asparagus officinalis TaxID=4686 RepID=UPI00098DEE4C|nr:protein BIG GRAIN 1-like E [Asparagus officinalis]
MQGIHTPMSSFSHSHCRKNSGELDVFEATRYFSSVADIPETCRAIKTERTRSLVEAKLPQEAQQRTELKHAHMTKEKVVKCKQPSSPGAKLATFLNSFQQYYSSSKKKKPSRLIKGEDEYSSRRRKSSCKISNVESKSSNYSSTSSSFSSKKREGLIKDNDCEALGDEFRLKLRLGDEHSIRKEEEEMSDGGESDSSSDLFELKINYEFNEISSSGLPVYETTHLGVIRRGAGLASTIAYRTS